jgi:hypothetical protein
VNSRISTVLFALAIALGSSATARGDWPPEGVLVSTTSASLGLDPVQLIRDASGDVVVVWRLHNTLGSTSAAQRITETGAIAPGWPDYGVTLRASSQFDAASDDAGGAFDAYVSGDFNVYLERALGDASHLPPANPGWVVADTSQSEWYPAVAADGAGGVFVAWVRGTSKVYLKHLQSGGTPVPGWPTAGAALYPPTLQVALASPELLPDGAGGVYLMWLADGVRVQRFGGTGAIAPGWPPQGIELGSRPPELYSNPMLRLIPSGADHAIAAWVDRYPGSGWTRLFLNRFDSSGTIDPTWPASGINVISTSHPVGSIALVPDGESGVTVVWEQQSRPLMMHVLSDGTLPADYPGTGLSPLDPDAQYVPGTLFAATGNEGGVIVSWSDARPSRPGIRMRWFRADGSPEPTEPAAGRVITPPGVPATNRGLVEDGSGGACVAWQDDTNGTFSSYLLRLSHAPGTAVVGVGPTRENARLELAPPAPNPATAEITLRFTLRGDQPARIELLDLAGRTQRSLAVRGAGAQVARMGDLGRLPPGLYFVRLAQGALVRGARVAIVR